MEKNREIVSRDSFIHSEVERLTQEGKWVKDPFKSVTVALFDQQGKFVKFLSYDRGGVSSRFGSSDEDDFTIADSEIMNNPGFSIKEVH